ncbi:MAG: GGDEF domain-containing protein [Alphaproteobacteria bacterium]|nr:GGDEF domain-containing protein [Alphaproteobacteria bacterium]MBV9372569.1 GGDEF domain-containing protein [Alphaproteobacteria bacterium]MBV9900894.1 GGDEF domain-containing protein [Alphaproteobacteria bacterium]
MSKHSSDFAGMPVEATEENALLRAALEEAQQRIRELERNSEIDDLTPLPGARRFRAELERVAGLAQRHGTPGAVVGLELVGLGALREEHGHFAADAALVHVARLLCGLIRTTDVLARVGDAEFGLILDHLDLDSAIDAAERLVRCVADNPLDLGHVAVPLKAVAATTGILPGDSADDVMNRARANLQRVKAEG